MYQLPVVAGSGQPTKTDLSLVKQKLGVVLRSFGVKCGKEFPPADLYIDCRGIPDPSHYTDGTGDYPEVQKWIKDRIDLSLYYSLVVNNFQMLTARKGVGKEFDKPFTILCMCAHGIHRSRAMKNLLATALKANGYIHIKVE